MEKSAKKTVSRLVDQLSRQQAIEKLEIQEQKNYSRKVKKLNRLLLKYGSRICYGQFVSVTLVNYESIVKYDPEILELISDLNLKIQFSIL